MTLNPHDFHRQPESIINRRSRLSIFLWFVHQYFCQPSFLFWSQYFHNFYRYVLFRRQVLLISYTLKIRDRVSPRRHNTCLSTPWLWLWEPSTLPMLLSRGKDNSVWQSYWGYHCLSDAIQTRYRHKWMCVQLHLVSQKYQEKEDKMCKTNYKFQLSSWSFHLIIMVTWWWVYVGDSLPVRKHCIARDRRCLYLYDGDGDNNNDNDIFS